MASRSQPRFSSLKLLRSLRKIRASEDEVPSGFLTLQKWASKWNMSRPHAQTLIRGGVEAGSVEVRRFRIATAGGVVRSIPHYAAK